MKIALILGVLFMAGCSSLGERYYKTPEYKCERVCIDANRDFQKVKDPGCLCKYKGNQD